MYKYIRRFYAWGSAAVYFWNAKALARDLYYDKVSDKDKLVYFLLSGASGLLPPGERSSSWAESVIFTVLFALGTVWCYGVNARNGNRDYIVRVICLSTPIIVRIIVFAHIALVPVALLLLLIKLYLFGMSWSEIHAFDAATKSFRGWFILVTIFAAYFLLLRRYLLYMATLPRTEDNNSIRDAS